MQSAPFNETKDSKEMTSVVEKLGQRGLFNFVWRNRAVWLLAVYAVALSLDQSSKIWAQKNLAEPYEIKKEVVTGGVAKIVMKDIFYPTKVVEVIPNLMNFIYKVN